MPFKKYLSLIFPDEEYSSVFEIEYKELKKSGVEAIIFDFDNTLSTWKNKILTDEVLELLKKLEGMGFKVGILTNSKLRGLDEIKENSDYPIVYDASKPRSKGFKELLNRLKVEPEKSVMIGDQIFTDMLGANRLSMKTILVSPINPGEEFILTKINRFWQNIILKARNFFRLNFSLKDNN